MGLIELNTAAGLEDMRLRKRYDRLQGLLTALRTRALPDDLVFAINEELKQLNAPKTSPAHLRRALVQKELRILRLVEKKAKLVTPGYYRQMWTGLGMSAFGLPLGVAIGTSLGNLAYLALGLPIGLAIGSLVGRQKDKQAAAENRQLIF